MENENTKTGKVFTPRESLENSPLLDTEKRQAVKRVGLPDYDNEFLISNL